MHVDWRACDGRFLDRAVHALDLAIGPGVAHLCQAMLDPVLRADPIVDVLHRIAILFAVCELDAVAGEECVDTVGQRRDEIAQELGSGHLAGLFLQPHEGEL